MFLVLIVHLLSAQAGAPPDSPSTAAPAPQPESESMLPAECSGVTQPEWLRIPAAEDRAQVYPPAAEAARLGGSATIECSVTANGRLAQCAVVEETPESSGFGAATIAVAPKFRMRSVTRAGCPVGGAKVRIPMTWKPDILSWKTPARLPEIIPSPARP